MSFFFLPPSLFQSNGVSSHQGPPPPLRKKEGGEEKLSKKQEQTLFNDLRQGIAILTPTGWLKYKVVHVTLWFQNGVWVTPLSQQGGFKNTRWFISHLFQNGVWPPFCYRVVQIKKSLSHDNPQQQQQRHEPGSLLDQSADAAGKKEK